MPQAKQLTIKQAITQAKKAIKKGNPESALQLYKAVLQHQPNHPVAKKELRKLKRTFPDNSYAQTQATGLSQDQINAMINLYHSGQMRETELFCMELLQADPESLIVLNVLGAVSRRQGKVKEAVQAFDKAIKLKPDYAEAYNNRGNALLDLGQREKAIESYGKAIEFAPDYAEAYNYRGVAFQDLGQLQKAVENYEKAIGFKPDYAEAYNNLGNTFKKLDQLGKALESYSKAIELKPDYAEAYNNLGNIFKGLGQIEEALVNYGKAIELKPDYAEAYSNRGNALKGLGQLEKAVNSYNRAISLKPDYAEAYSNLGAALQDFGQTEKAMLSYNKAIELKPDYAEAHNNLGNIFKNLGQMEQALMSYNKAIKLKPNCAEAYNNIGALLQDFGQMEKAIENYNKAIELKSDYAEAYNNLGSIFNDLGEPGKARANYSKAIELKPDYAEAHRNLSTLKKYKLDDAQLKIMENLYTNSIQTESNRMHLCFALGKAYEDLGEYHKSFESIRRGNHLRKKELNYNIHNDRRMFAKIMEFFREGVLASDIVPERQESICPIFIVGMPRSGTSLVEQILATHSKVYGAGELGIMNTLVGTILSHLPDQNVSQDGGNLSRDIINTIHAGYLEALFSLKTPEKIITDKMPLNFRWIGFILTAFPASKIINLTRDPRATCWSIYKHYFSNPGNGYAYDISDLAEFHKLYIDLMSFWRKRFPYKIYDLCYEALTENQEEETRSLLSFCDLEWEEQCLNFHKTKRTVKTASAAQVRKKLYKGSSEDWRKYAEHLQPLISALGH